MFKHPEFIRLHCPPGPPNLPSTQLPATCMPDWPRAHTFTFTFTSSLPSLVRSTSLPVSSAMDDGLHGIRARLQSPLASVESNGPGNLLSTNSSTKFSEAYYQRKGLLEVKVEGEEFFEHAGFKYATILQNDTRESSDSNINLEFVRTDEAYLQNLWILNVSLELLRYAQLLGKPVEFAPIVSVEPLPEWKGKGDAGPDFG